MRNRPLVSILACGALVLATFGNASAQKLKSVKQTTREDSVPGAFIPAFNAGYNKLLTGYNGYKNIGSAGLDLHYRLRRKSSLPTEWYHNLLWRLSFDYFPLQVPDGVYNVTEDIFSLNTGFTYQFQRLNRNEEARWIPFFGLGIGIYQDRLTLDTPASGKITGKKNNMGYNASIGIFTPPFKLHWQMRLMPEIRYHRMDVPDGSATNMTFQVGLCLWPTVK